jgi:hypothetical protein
MDPNSSLVSTRSSQSNLIWYILIGSVVSALTLLLVTTEKFVFGSSPGQWVYRYFETPSAIPFWLLLTVGLSLGLSVFLGSKFIHSHEKITLLVSFLNALCLQILIRQAYPFSLGTLVQSDKANSFYTSAINFSGLDILREFDSLAPSLSFHARTNMPGKILLFEFFTLFTSSPEIMGYLVIALSTLGGLLLYVICKQLFHNQQTAFYALTLYVLIPGKLFFFPILNTVTPVFILLSFTLFLLYIEKKSNLVAGLLGSSLYVLLLFEPSPLITGILFLGILVHAMIQRRLSIRNVAGLILNLVLGFLGMHVVFSLVFSFDLFQAFEYVLSDAVSFNLDQGRPYWLWIMENTKEFFFGVGVPIMLIFIFMNVQIVRRWKKLGEFKNWSTENVFVISLLITYFVLAILGVNRGEVTRLWIYLAAFFQVPAASFLAKIQKGEALFFLVAGTLLLQIMQTINRVGFIKP